MILQECVEFLKTYGLTARSASKLAQFHLDNINACESANQLHRYMEAVFAEAGEFGELEFEVEDVEQE